MARVNMEPAGVGEALLIADANYTFQNWQKVKLSVTPGVALKTFGHMEAGGLNRPGDAAVAWALGNSPIPPGSPTAVGVYGRTHTQGAATGAAWDHPEGMTALEQFQMTRNREQEIATSDFMNADAARAAGAFEEAPEDDFSIFGAIKGLSRWFMLGLDVIPEGADALMRAASFVKSGDLTVAQAAGGMFGFDQQAAQMVGIPLFQYLRSAVEGERLNMGTGWFAQGTVAPEIQAQMALYDEETHGVPMTEGGEPVGGLTHSDFLREAERNNGHVVVRGLGGTTYEALNVEEWKQLRDTVGRAALISDLSQNFSATQQELGTPHGTFQEQIFDEANVLRRQSLPDLLTGNRDRAGTYFSTSVGRLIAAPVLEPDTIPFNALSGTVDLTKQLADLNLIGASKTVISKFGRMIGLAGEQGDLARATKTVTDIFSGSDVPARQAVLNDLFGQTVNREAAVNALGRHSDEALRSSLDTINTLRRLAADDTPDAAEGAIDAMINKVIGGKSSGARVWAERLLSGDPRYGNVTSPDEIAQAVQAKLSHLTGVGARQGVDLVGGRFGPAVIPDELAAELGNRVDELTDVLSTRKGSVVQDPTNGGLLVTFDADLGRAQNTLRTLGTRVSDEVAARHDAARAYVDADFKYQTRWAELSSGEQKLAGVKGTQLSKEIDEAYQPVLEAAAHPALGGVVRVGVDGRAVITDPGKLRRWADMDVAEETGRSQARLFGALYQENQMYRRTAERLLGDGDEASSSVDELTRVMRRITDDEDIVNAVFDARPRLNPGQVNRLLTGGGKANALVKQLVAARTHDEVLAILRPTVELSGHIPPGLIDALARSSDESEVVEMFTRLAAGQAIKAPKIALLEKAARFGNLSTVAGMTVGGLAGAGMELDEGGNWADIVGGGLAGAVFGALAGSSIGGVGGLMMKGTTRKIEDVGDAMDLLLAGARSTTMDFLRSNGVPLSEAQHGLGIPSLFNYAYGHSAVGRRLMRHPGTRLSINDPTAFYYTVAEYARSLGVHLDDTVETFRKGTGEAAEVEKLVHRLTDDVDAARQDLLDRGFVPTNTYRMDDVLSAAANMAANNPGQAHRVLVEFGQVIDAVMSTRGMDAARISFLKDFFREGAQNFLGATDALGRPAAYAQMMASGRVKNLDDGARLEAELWSGHVDLPAPERVFRAVSQLDTLGRVTQLFTGAGVTRQIRDNMKRIAAGSNWERITPELERNVALRTARAITSGLWAPLVLLGRPLSFLTRVMGDDQFRMTASGLDTSFAHPFSYLSAIVANYDVWKNRGALRGVASRSIIPDELIGDFGKVNRDVLDDMNNWSLAEESRHALAIYDRELASSRKKRPFGARSWTQVEQGEAGYLEALSTEIRQLIEDPMVRKLARSKSNDPVAETIAWLNTTSEGRRVKADWGRQFRTRDDAAEFMTDDYIAGFLHDQYARLHLKTGGDWVFVQEKGLVINSQGDVIGAAELQARGLDNLTPGYHITRRGDDDLREMIGSGRVNSIRRTDVDGEERILVGRERQRLIDSGVEYLDEKLRVSDHIDEEKWNLIQDVVKQYNDYWKSQVKNKGYDPLTNHAFPLKVKTARDAGSQTELKGIIGLFDDALDRIYDRVLGTPTRIFSRQPTMGAFFWERVAMLYPSMDAPTQRAFRAIAEKEGTWKAVNRAQRQFGAAGGPNAPGTITSFQMADINAKAYAVERTRDILFDLHRQRNFVDGFRLIFPFAGPFMEAIEAWSRLVAREPFTVWRRGTQLKQHLWNTSGIGDDPDPMGTGWFWTNDQGEEMITYPFAQNISNMLNTVSGGEIDMPPLSARLRGFNVIFGTDPMPAGEEAEISGFPLQAFSPGTGPVLQNTLAYALKGKGGVARDISNFLFPYGAPENFFVSMLPYNLRKAFEGRLGAQSQADLDRHSMDQFSRMVANGEFGPGMEYDPAAPGGLDAAMAEARDRAVAANWVEAGFRTAAPSVLTPEVLVDIENNPNLAGLDVDKLMTLDAFRNLAFQLHSEEGAQWFITPDGFRVSTEGDWQVVTDYMNQMFGSDMYSAEFLSLPLIDRAYPRVYTDEGLDWTNSRESVLSKLPASGSLIMPDYAGQKGLEDTGEYSYEAFDAAIARGDAAAFTYDEQKEQIQSRLLGQANRHIEQTAILRFGRDEDLDDEAQFAKNAWVSDQKQIAQSTFMAGDIPQGQKDKVFDDLLRWSSIDWQAENLTDEEAATVNAVLWYLDVRQHGLNQLQQIGVTKLSNEGTSDEQRAGVEAIRSDIGRMVEAQITYAATNGFDMGNFRFIYQEYLQPELIKDSDFDAMEALAVLRRDELESAGWNTEDILGY